MPRSIPDADRSVIYEFAMDRFKSAGSAQRFLPIHAAHLHYLQRPTPPDLSNDAPGIPSFGYAGMARGRGCGMTATACTILSCPSIVTVTIPSRRLPGRKPVGDVVGEGANSAGHKAAPEDAQQEHSIRPADELLVDQMSHGQPPSGARAWGRLRRNAKDILTKQSCATCVARAAFMLCLRMMGGKGTSDANRRGRPVVILDSLVSMNVGSGVTTERRILTSQPDGGSARCRSSRVPGQPNDSCPSTRPPATRSTTSAISPPPERTEPFQASAMQS